jgi:hypothetical protein
MITINSISGGKTSSYIAANYEADFNLFSLVRIDDINCKFPDEILRKRVEDKIQMPFIGTAEDDKIIYTMFDLEQFIGKEITWVSGITYDEVLKTKGGWLPNKLHRYCTTHLKIEPMFYWWANNINKPVKMRIGFRANEVTRKIRMIEKLNKDGFLEFKATFSKNNKGQNKWQLYSWQKPEFPLIDNRIFKDEIEKYWKDKPVRFAELNNCVGCFHRNPILLRKLWDIHPNKMEWFNNQEKLKKKGTWRSDLPYEKIKNIKLQYELTFSDFTECDSGYCGL